jgi:hypothetical protein
MRSTDRTTRKATPRKIKAISKGKTNGKTKAAKPSWVKRMDARMRRSMREDNRVFAVFAGAILKGSFSMGEKVGLDLSMNQKIALLKLVSEAISEDRARRIMEQNLHKAERAYCNEPNKKNRALVQAERRGLAGLGNEISVEMIKRYLGRPPTDDEIDQIERGVPFSTIVANIIAMQRLPSLSAQPAPAAMTEAPP